VIFVASSPGVAALKQMTPSIPIVFADLPDPIANGFVASLARPGGNITGFAQYGYLTAVYALVTWWAAEGQDVVRSQRAVRLSGLHVIAQEDPFAAVIRCTANPVKADKRTRSRWSRLMRYADEHNQNSEPLDQFVKRKGGINECVAQFSTAFVKNKKTTWNRLVRG
jgi:hypothetical protein